MSDFNKDDDLQYYTTDEVADFLKISRRTIYNLLEKGLLKGVKIGKTWRFSKQDIQDYIQKLIRRDTL